MTIAIPSANEVIGIELPVPSLINVPFAGRRARRKIRAHNAGFVKIVGAANVSVIIMDTADRESSQTWFWTPAWQAGEAQASLESAARRGVTFDSSEDFLNSLDD